MIRYALKCSRGHGFESWFQSAEAYEALAERRLFSCPECGESSVQKALMAPPVRPARAAASKEERAPKPALSEPTDPRERALAELRRKVEEGSDYVGMEFAREARAIHEGTAPNRSIYGEARPDEARKLLEEGIPVAPLPFTPKAKTN